jgi:hypothetical protein
MTQCRINNTLGLVAVVKMNYLEILERTDNLAEERNLADKGI